MNGFPPINPVASKFFSDFAAQAAFPSGRKSGRAHDAAWFPQGNRDAAKAASSGFAFGRAKYKTAWIYFYGHTKTGTGADDSPRAPFARNA